MSTATITLSPGQLEYLADNLEYFGTVRFTEDSTSLTFRMAEPLGVCPSCKEPVYAEDEPDGPVWTCPADLRDDNPWREPTNPAITESLRETTGVYSNCGLDYGFACYDEMPLHSECYERGEY